MIIVDPNLDLNLNRALKDHQKILIRNLIVDLKLERIVNKRIVDQRLKRILKKDLNIEIKAKVDRKRNVIPNQEIAIEIVKKSLN